MNQSKINDRLQLAKREASLLSAIRDLTESRQFAHAEPEHNICEVSFGSRVVVVDYGAIKQAFLAGIDANMDRANQSLSDIEHARKILVNA